MEATVKTFTPKYDASIAKDDLLKEISDLRKENREAKADIIKWIFIFWLGQIAATFIIFSLFVKK